METTLRVIRFTETQCKYFSQLRHRHEKTYWIDHNSLHSPDDTFNEQNILRAFILFFRETLPSMPPQGLYYLRIIQLKYLIP